MTVAELIAELQKMPQDAEVYIYMDHPGTIGWDREPSPHFRDESSLFNADRTLVYPRGRVGL